MQISVIDKGITIQIINGVQETVEVFKNQVWVTASFNNVRINWSPVNYVEYNYNLFTNPSGANAIVVANLISAMLVNKKTQLLDYDLSGNLVYVGNAAAGSAISSPLWSIQKLSYSGTTLTTIQWSNGNLLFENIWDNRASISYS